MEPRGFKAPPLLHTTQYTMAYLEVDHVTKRYSEHTALNEVSLSAHEGRIFGLLGPNGAGKSSLIRVINRITAPDSGEVRLEGRPPERGRPLPYRIPPRGAWSLPQDEGRRTGHLLSTPQGA